MALISVSEAAIRLGVNAATVRRLCKSGHLPAVRVGPKLWRIDDSLPLTRPVPISQRNVHPIKGRIQ